MTISPEVQHAKAPGRLRRALAKVWRQNGGGEMRPSLPLAVSGPERQPHPAEAISGPFAHRMWWFDRLWWRWRVWRTERMGPQL